MSEVSFSEMIMMIAIVPYFVFLYFLYRIWKLDKHLLHPSTLLGFAFIVGFVTVTSTSAFVAIKVLGAASLSHMDWLHALSEFSMTITNGLIVIGLKRQINKVTAEKRQLRRTKILPQTQPENQF